LNPGLTIIARAHFDAEVDSLKVDGATVVIMGEREIARGMVEQVMATANG
jgi:CPA2 family monovalent cation:H+ antiporter-2